MGAIKGTHFHVYDVQPLPRPTKLFRYSAEDMQTFFRNGKKSQQPPGVTYAELAVPRSLIVVNEAKPGGGTYL